MNTKLFTILFFGLIIGLSSCKINREIVNEPGIKGVFYTPLEGKSEKAMLIFAGGAQGDYWGNVLAQRNCAVLSVSYYGAEGLPKNRENIPLEFFKPILKWLSKNAGVSPNKIIIMGASNEGELALQLAAHFPDLVGGVIGLEASTVSWSNTVLPQNSDKIMPSWTFNKKAVPYIKMPKIKGGKGTEIKTMPYWQKGLADSSKVKKALVKAENISGPILLISGKDDQVWPAAQMADILEKHLKSKDSKPKFQNIQYENAGHLISAKPGTFIPSGFMDINGKKYKFDFGGTRKGNISSQKKALQNIMDYVAEF